MDLNTYLALLVFAALMVLSPGPANLLLMSAGGRWGLRLCLPFIAGITIGKLLLNIALGVGLFALLAAHPYIELGMQIVSALYMIWLAIKVAGIRLRKNDAAVGHPKFREGLIVHPLNPKAWAMLTFAYSQYTDADAAWLPQWAILAATFFVMECIGHPLWCWSGVPLVRSVAGTRWERFVMNGLALLTILVVVWSLVYRP